MDNTSENRTSYAHSNDSNILVDTATEDPFDTGNSIQELYDYISPKTLEWILIATYILTFLTGVIGNVLVCFVVWRNMDLRTVTNIFIVNLSLADLLILIFLLPSVLLVDVTATWFLGNIPCKLHVFFAVSFILMSLFSKLKKIILNS